MASTGLSAKGMPAKSSVRLDEQEQERLIHAIESAIEVRQRDQFHGWILGPFHALLPYESAVCIEIDEHGAAHHVECLRHNLLEAATMDALCNSERGVAVRLALSGGVRLPAVRILDSAALQTAFGDTLGDYPSPCNAVIHRTRLLSGAAYCFVLFNLPEDRLDRCQHLFKLLSSHLKMAVSQAFASRRRASAPLTRRELEILRWMGEGRSNRQISTDLGISAITLKNHITKLYRKLDVQSRAEAVSRGLLAHSAHPGPSKAD